jgi:anti-sigma B factor antagonist
MRGRFGNSEGPLPSRRMRARRSSQRSCVYADSPVPATFTHHGIDPDATLRNVSGVYELREELLERAVARRIRIVAVSGDLDMAAAPAFEQTLFETVTGEEPTILDLSEVTFMDSTAIGAMLAVRRQAELKPGRFAIVCEADGEIERTLLYMGLDATFSIAHSRAAAAAELAGA